MTGIKSFLKNYSYAGATTVTVANGDTVPAKESEKSHSRPTMVVPPSQGHTYRNLISVPQVTLRVVSGKQGHIMSMIKSGRTYSSSNCYGVQVSVTETPNRDETIALSSLDVSLKI
jgi:hypothetical protein